MAVDHYFFELEPPEERLRYAPHVVIVGGGFAGIQTCRALAKSKVRITLIDKLNFSLFQPLLYQVATGLVTSGDIATPLRELVGKQPKVQILLGEVTQFNSSRMNTRSCSTEKVQLRPSRARNGSPSPQSGFLL
jgi:NADH dehydrogenase